MQIVQLKQNNAQVGCHVKQFYQNWEQIAPDPWVLKIVSEGLRLQFQSLPPESGVKITCVKNISLMSNIIEEVEKLFQKGAIEYVPKGQEGRGFYSTFFTVPKKGGGIRPILNLKPLNVFLQKEHFKMETLRSIIQAMQPGDWAVSIDLKDAYLHIPVHVQHRKYLRFCIHNRHYQFRAMPFGLAVAPRIFTKVMAAVGGHLRCQQIHIFMYLDDWLIRNQSKDLLQMQLFKLVNLLVDLGLLINVEKSQFIPSQIITYLGAVFNLQEGQVYPSESRFIAIQQAIAEIVRKPKVHAVLFLRMLGLMASCIDIVPLARLHMRPIQLYLLCFWRPHYHGLLYLVPVLPALLIHLRWWQERHNLFKGVPLQFTPHTQVLWTDASLMGWGAHLEHHQAAGQWTEQFKLNHINLLEMQAVWNALKTFQASLQNRKVLVRCDNATVVAYINKQGGTRSLNLCVLLWEMMQWCIKHKIQIFAAHIPGKKNCLADKLSRGRTVIKLTEWSLKEMVVNQVFHVLGVPNIDLFATRLNKKLPVFCSPYPDVQALACDALSIAWTNMFAYAFPPPILLPKVLNKVQEEDCTILLIAPIAPHQSWFPQLLELVIDVPIKLPVLPDLLSQNNGQSLHPNPQSLNLAVWKVSRTLSLQEGFQRKLQSFWIRLNENPPKSSIEQDYTFTKIGVLNGISIPLKHL